MKIKVFPPIVMLFFAGLMLLLNWILPFGEFHFFGQRVLTYSLIILSILISTFALFLFIRARTTIDPIYPEKTKQLVTNGIFQYTRNPMYLSLLLLLIAFGLYLGNAFNTLLVAGFVYYINHFQIKKEEKFLTEKFGKEYTLYQKMVRRWF